MMGIFFYYFVLSLLSAQEYPSPVGWVNDFAQVIDSEYERRLINLITEVERKTGAEIAIATIETSYPKSIDMYAVELFTKWGIGKKDKDNGVLIVLSLKEKQVWIETGYGVEGILPDGLCGEIYRKILRPNFRQGKFGEGLLLATTVIADKIGKEYGVKITGTEVARPIYYNRRRVGICGLLSPFLFLFLFFLIFGRLGIFGLLPFMLLGTGRGFWGSGTFGGGGGFSGGFGGFGGGSCGGGGAGGGW
jgi:uncharacterized protein